MNDLQFMDSLIKKAIGEKVKEDAEMVSRAFYTLIQKYAFLFEGDMLETQRILTETCFPVNHSVVERTEDEDIIYFDIEGLVGAIPDSTKKEVYGHIMNEFAAKVSIEDISKKGGVKE